MEAPEKGDTAEAVARYFATLDRKASAHYCCDRDSVIQSVRTKDVAYAAPGANHDGVHIELAGYARQTVEEWADDYSKAMLQLAAQLCAKVLCGKFTIPIVYLSAEMMRAKPDSRGFTTHAEVSKAFHKSTHTDPGKAFPIVDFLALVRAAR
jgi:N-acetyl-anhydromuramyl-L-alanine amidase AmpD